MGLLSEDEQNQEGRPSCLIKPQAGLLFPAPLRNSPGAIRKTAVTPPDRTTWQEPFVSLPFFLLVGFRVMKRVCRPYRE